MSLSFVLRMRNCYLMPGNTEKRRAYILELHEELDEIGGVSIVSRLAETYSAGAAYEEAIPLLRGNAAGECIARYAFRCSLCLLSKRKG